MAWTHGWKNVNWRLNGTRDAFCVWFFFFIVHNELGQSNTNICDGRPINRHTESLKQCSSAERPKPRNESEEAVSIIRRSQKQSPACFSLHRWQGKENVLFFWDRNRTSVKMISDVSIIFLWVRYHWARRWGLEFLIFFFASVSLWALG